MSEQTFICRVRGGSEEKALRMAAQRVTRAWMPFTLQSRRISRRKAFRVSVQPLMGYMWVTATHQQRDHMLQSPLVHKALWFLDTPRRVMDAEAFQRRVEDQFNIARGEYTRSARQFHHNFKRGQAVKLMNEGLETFQGKFAAQVVGGPNDGLLRIDADMMGRNVTVFADPYDVAANG